GEIFARLPTELRAAARGWREGRGVAEMSRRLKVSRATVHRRLGRVVLALRAYFFGESWAGGATVRACSGYEIGRGSFSPWRSTMVRQSSYRFTFARSVPVKEVADTLRLAVLAAEAIHGEVRVALDVRHRLNSRRRQCLIGAGTRAGRDLAKLFGNFVRREFGAGAIRVERFEGGMRESQARSA